MSNAAPEPKKTPARERWEKEQAALAREQGGVQDIRIQAPKEPEVNPEIYRDVEPMLFNGFISQAALIGEVTFVFKSLNQHEYDLLRMMGMFEKDRGVGYKLWDTLLAYNVFM